MMNSAPVISILTTVYNREKFIAECIESVQNGHWQDYEHIIVDDRSTDRSLEIAQEFASKDPRIRVYQNEENLGDYPNRNKAASYAKGKYIKYLDADDMHGRFMVDIMVDAMETFPEAGYGLFDYGEHKPLFPFVLNPAEAFEAHYSGKHQIFNRSPINAIIKKDVFDAVGGFSGKRMVGDFEMWHTLSSKYVTVVMSAGPGLYRIHDNQEMSLHRTDPIWAFNYLTLSINMFTDEETNPMEANKRQKILNSLLRIQARTILYSIKKCRIRDSLRLKSASKRTWVEILRNAFVPL